ncbi:hypothetical protein LL355_001273 [Providencia stuartii]
MPRIEALYRSIVSKPRPLISGYAAGEDAAEMAAQDRSSMLNNRS